MMDVEIKDEIPNLYSLDPEKGIKDAIDCLMQCLECEFEDTPLELAGNQLFIIVVKKNYSFYTFDKGNKLQVYIEDKVFLEKVKYSANIQKEVELNNHILKLQKPALDIQIGFDSKNEIYSINFVLISDGYEKMENIEKEFGDLLNHQKKMNFLENEVVMNNNFIEFFKEIQLLEKVITKLKNKKNYLGVGSCKLFFNKYDYLYLSDKTCTKSHEGSEFLYGKIYIDEQYAIAYDYNLKIKENVKNEDLNFNSNHNFSLNPKPSNMNREETGDTELSEIDDEMTMKIDESPTMKIVKPENSPPNNINSTAVEKDASGNLKLGDIGTFLRDRIKEYFKNKNIPMSLKYIDPSYLIRANCGNAGDQLFCTRLAQNAVHAAMSGRTGMLIGYWHGRMTHVPLAAISGRQRINPAGELWFNVLESTGQPAHFG